MINRGLDGSRKLRPFFRCLERLSGPVQREGPRFVKRRVLHLNVGPADGSTWSTI